MSRDGLEVVRRCMVGSFDAAACHVSTRSRRRRCARRRPRPAPYPSDSPAQPRQKHRSDDHVDPPDLPLRPTLRRLFPLWWEQRRLAALGLACALVFTALSIAIPILIQQRDRRGDRRPAPQPAAAVPRRSSSCSRTLRFGVNFTRRFATARVGIAVEARLRGLLYDAYLTLPARVLRPARDRRGDLARDERHLPRPLLHRLGRRPGHPERDDDHRRGDRARARERAAGAYLRARDAADRRPDLVLRAPPLPDLAPRAGEEGPPRPRPPTRRSSGSRWCRRSAARTTCGRASSAAPRRCATRRCGRRPSRRTSCPGLLFLPTLGIAAVLFFGGRDVIAGKLTIGEFMLFITLLLQLVWPLEALGWIINLGQRAVASAGRSFAWLEGIEPLAEPAEPKQLPAGPLDVRFEDVRFAYGTEAEVLRGVDLAVEPGEIVAVCGPTGLRQDDAAQPAPPLLRPDRRPRARRRRRHARRRPRGAAPRRRDRDAEARPLLRAPAREPALGAAGRRLGGGARRLRGRRASRPSSTTCRTATTR